MGSSPSTSHRLPLALAVIWLLTTTCSLLAVPVLIATVPYWHEVRGYLQQLGLWQTWVSVVACVGLLALSRRKYAETEERWAQGALPIYVLGGMVTAIAMNYGVLPLWLAHPASWLKMAQLLGLVLLHWCCALLAWRSLWHHHQQAA